MTLVLNSQHSQRLKISGLESVRIDLNGNNWGNIEGQIDFEDQTLTYINQFVTVVILLQDEAMITFRWPR